MAGIFTAVVATVATASSLINQRKADKAAKKANEKAMRIEAVKAQRERVDTIRQQRIANATVIQSGAASGTLSSSGSQGALASFNTQTANNVSLTGQLNELNMQRMQFMQQQQTFLGRGQMASTVAGFALQAGSFAASKGAGNNTNGDSGSSS